uniref:Uncharacterized protein n=1 Tax=Panagrolaimus sp. ES5 TaxID=591445 RepID=A0AC34FW28_9BILA
MSSFFIFTLNLWFWITVVGASTSTLPDHDEDIREIQTAIVQQLNQNRHLNAIQQNEEIKSLLEALEPETRQKYQLWIDELQELEKERVKKLREMMLQLSPEGQQNFAKILFIQQSETLSQDQKIKRLNEVTADMPKHVKEELSEQVKHQEMLKKFLQTERIQSTRSEELIVIKYTLNALPQYILEDDFIDSTDNAVDEVMDSVEKVLIEVEVVNAVNALSNGVVVSDVSEYEDEVKEVLAIADCLTVVVR